MTVLPGTHIFDTTMTVQQCVQSDLMLDVVSWQKSKGKV